jgi:hypothetical protein
MNKMKDKTPVEWLELQIKEILKKNDIIIEDAVWNTARQMEIDMTRNVIIDVIKNLREE